MKQIFLEGKSDFKNYKLIAAEISSNRLIIEIDKALQVSPIS